MNSYLIKYLPRRLANFQAAIYKDLLLAKFSNSTTIYIIKKFHLPYKGLALLQRILLIVAASLLLKALEE